MVDIRRFFESRLRRYGDSPKTLDWSEEGQRRRFEVLAEVGELHGRSVLDVGCGLGHFLNFLEAKSIRSRYAGLDLSPRLIERARELHPAAAFEVLDVTGRSLPRRADYAVASGVLNVETGTNEADMRRMIRACFQACDVAAAMNMLSTWADWREPGRHYYEPIRMVRLARRVSRRVVLRHDYMPHDFTLYLYRGESR